MRVVIKRGFSLVNDMRFDAGPVYIGREPRSHIYLPDRAVSRRHAVLTTDAEGKWLVQDLDSVNHTMLNGRVVAKMPVREGDVVGVGDFTLEIHVEDERLKRRIEREEPVDLGDTMVEENIPVPGMYKTTRGTDHVIHLPPGRVTDFYDLAVMLFQQKDQETLVAELTRLLIKQFDAYHAWMGLRETTEGPITCHGGCMSDGSIVPLELLGGRKIIQLAISESAYILLPNAADLAGPADSCTPELSRLCSAMATPIMTPAGAFGIIYVDNGRDKAAYTQPQLDYLTLVSIQVAALTEHIA